MSNYEELNPIEQFIVWLAFQPLAARLLFVVAPILGVTALILRAGDR